MNPEVLKKLSQEGESKYAPTPPSGRGEGNLEFKISDIIDKLKPISIRKPLVMIVGSLATQGKSNNDIDIVIRGEDFPEKLKEAINFRLYRLFSDILGCKYDDVTKYLHILYNNAGSYTSYIPIYELNLVPFEDYEVVEMSNKIPFSLNGNIDIVEKSNDDNRRIIAGYASVAVVDSENQFIPVDALKKGLESLIKDPNYANLMLVHKNIQIGKILLSYGDLETKVDDKGLFIVAEIRNDLRIADEVWHSILNGDLNGFSIGCEVLTSHKECDDKQCIEILDEINIFEVSICSMPVNEQSGFIVVSKSKYDDLFDSVCSKCSKENGIMPEEENIEVVEESSTLEESLEEDKSTEEESEIEDKSENSDNKIAELEREIESIKGILNELLNAKKEEKPSEEPNEEEEEEEKGGLVDVIKRKLEELMKKDKITKEDIKGVLELVNNLRGKYPYPYPYPEKYPYPKKSIDTLISKMDELLDKLSAEEAKKEFELSIKARDDKIAALEKKIETLTKSKEEKKEAKPKTVTSEEEEEISYKSSVNVEGGNVYID